MKENPLDEVIKSPNHLLDADKSSGTGGVGRGESEAVSCHYNQCIMHIN